MAGFNTFRVMVMTKKVTQFDFSVQEPREIVDI